MASIIRKIICSPHAPKPLGPYSQAVQVDRTLYVSGVVGIDNDTGKIVTGGTVAEAKLVLQTLGHILEAAGASYGNVVKATVLLKDMDDFASVNEIYKEYFKEPYPARVAYQVSRLPAGARIEIEAIAIVGKLETCKM